MKRTVQMMRAGIPKAGMRPGHFKGWRNPHWHQTRIVTDLNHQRIVTYREQPVAIIKGART